VSSLIELLLIVLILANLVLVGSSRLATGIKVAGTQGFALGVLPLLLPEHHMGAGVILLALGSMAIKGIIFPLLLFRAMRIAGVRHEIVPVVGFSLSVLIGIVGLAASLWLGLRLEPPRPPAHPLLLPTALFTVLTGLFLIVNRIRALSQVIGYLVLENGIYLFGLALAREVPLLVEMGVLLDVFVAVFVMGITIFHISREFDHIDVDQLSALKD
jgi:hydrogenase-4 component E